MKRQTLLFSSIFFFLQFLFIFPGCSTSSVMKKPETLPPIVKKYRHMTLYGNQPAMVKTGVNINEGDCYSILATGSVDLWLGGPAYHDVRPEHGWPFMLRIGKSAYTCPLRNRNAITRTSHHTGDLYLGIRDGQVDPYGESLEPYFYSDNAGSFSVDIIVWATEDIDEIVAFFKKTRIENPENKAVLDAMRRENIVIASERASPPTVSLEEAKKITATFNGQDFIPPPRTINDITDILSEERLADLKDFQKTQAKSLSKPPKTNDPAELAEFYLNRGHAAIDIGRTKQAREDYRLAVQYGEKTEFHCLNVATWLLGMTEALYGNLSRGREMARKSLLHTKGPHQLAARSAVLAWGYAECGDLKSAQELLQQADEAAALTRKLPDGEWKNVMNSNICAGRASVLDAMGKFSEAEIQYRKAISSFQTIKDGSPWRCFGPKHKHIWHNKLINELGENLVFQERLVEAEIEARKALGNVIRIHGLYSHRTPIFVRGLIEVLFEQGRFAESEVLARANLKIYEHVGSDRKSTLVGIARSLLADSILAQRRWKEAVLEYDSARNALKADPASYHQWIGSKASLWIALIKAGRASEALNLIGRVLGKKRELLGEEQYSTAETRGVLAMALAAIGQKESALREFSKAIPILLDRANREERGDETRTARDFRLELILESYIQLLANIHGTALEKKAGLMAAEEAFRLADIARGRTVKRALAASSARASLRDPALADLARRERDALTQIGALKGLLSNVLSASGAQQNLENVKDLRLRIDRLRRARITLMKEIEARFPDYANLVDPKPLSMKEVQKNLRPGEALVATYVGEDGSYVWAIPHEGSAEFSTTGLDVKKTGKMVMALRASLDPRVNTLGDLPAFDVETGYRLYEALLKPVEAGWKDAKKLLLVAHGALGFLPFSVLLTKAEKLGPEKRPLFSNYRSLSWLARTHAVTVLPSVASLRTLRNLPKGDLDRKPFTGFGDPCFSPTRISQEEQKRILASPKATRGVHLNRRGLIKTNAKDREPDSVSICDLPSLPDTADEVLGIAQALEANPEQDVFLGRSASEENVKSMDLSRIKVLAFATHGLLPGELDGLSQPALALSSPAVTGGEEDGLLTMGEILGLKLHADWVVLSACNTGAGEGVGAEAVSGLGRAFFYAGTKALLVSNWAVETTSAKKLTTQLFRRYAADPGLRRSEALNSTMLDMIDQLGFINTEGKMVFSYAHPAFWAPFSLVGDGG